MARLEKITSRYVVSPIIAIVWIIAIKSIFSDRPFPWRNGDHMYYVSMALKFAGIPHEQALRKTTELFPDWPGQAPDLNRGYFNLDIAPLIYPRVGFSELLAVTYRAVGDLFIVVTPILFGLLTTLLFYKWFSSRFSRVEGLYALAIASASYLYVHYFFGLFVESLVAFIAICFLYLLPIGAYGKRIRFKFVTAALLIFCLSFSRQIPTLLTFVCFAGYIATFAKTRNLRNEWFPITILVTIVTGACYFIVAKWAPYNPLPYLVKYYDIERDSELPMWFVNHFVTNLQVSFHTALKIDPFLFIIFVLAIRGAWIERKKDFVLISICLASWISCSVTMLLNRPEYRFWAPAIIFTIPIAVVGIRDLVSKLRRPDKRVIASSSNTKDTSYLGEFTPVAISMISTALLLGMLFHYYGRTEPVLFQVSVDKSLSPTKELSNSIGTVTCRGNDAQLVLTSRNNDLYALTGTAMAHNYGMPSIDEFKSNNKSITVKKDVINNLVSKCLKAFEGNNQRK
jgi:hypothetical protein